MPGIIPPGHPQALPQGQTIPNWLLRRIGTVATLGLYNFNQSAKANGDYWSEIAREFDPRTPQGLVALGATVFGPRLDDPEVTSIDTPAGLVPLPHLNKMQRATSNPARNLRQDFAAPVLTKLLRARESEPVARHIESVSRRASAQALPEDAHSLAENNDMTRGEPSRPPRVLRETLRPTQQQLLQLLLSRERLA